MVPIPAIRKGSDTCKIVWYHLSFLSFLSPAFGRIVVGSGLGFKLMIAIAEFPLKAEPFPLSPLGMSFLSLEVRPAVDTAIHY